jgi:hypothetical protein
LLTAGSIALGTCLATSSLLSWQRERQIRHSGVQVLVEVVGLRKTPYARGGCSFQVTYQFALGVGTDRCIYEREAEALRDEYGQLEVGQLTEAVYNPDNAEESRLRNEPIVGTSSVIRLVAGLLCVMAGGIGLIALVRRHRAGGQPLDPIA